MGVSRLFNGGLSGDVPRFNTGARASGGFEYLRFWADRTAANLRHGGYLEHAEKMENCCKIFSAMMCEHCGSDRLRASPHHCGIRLCSICEESRAVSNRRITRILLKRPNLHLKFLTLTFKNRPEISGEWLSENTASFRRFRNRKAWGEHVNGGLVSQEVTYTERNGYHPHLHIVMDAGYWNQFEISRIWNEVTRGDGRIINIKEIHGDRVDEFCKYVAKASQYSDQWRVTVALFEALKGKRLFFGFGDWDGVIGEIKKEIKAERKSQNCPNCGSGLTWAGSVNAQDVYLCPVEGQLYVLPETARGMVMEHGSQLSRIAKIRGF